MHFPKRISRLLLPALAFAFAAACATPAFAQIITVTQTFTPGLDIPDGDPSGISDIGTFSSGIQQITEVRLRLNIVGIEDGAFNGDYYATLSYNSGFAVLLNRVGRLVDDDENDFGYSDNGFDVTFDDSPNSQPDIHNYQLTVDPMGGALTGVWSSDGRDFDPFNVTEGDQRSAFLTSFEGLNPNGDWTLFVSDVSELGTGRLESWTLEVTGSAIPEPSTYAAIFGAAALMAAMCRRRFRGKAHWRPEI